MFQVKVTAETVNCRVGDCHRLAPAYCYCCKQSVCTHHFLEHIERIKAKIDPLANEVKTTIESIEPFTVEQLSRPVFAQLNEWQTKMHVMIDDIHVKKTKEIGEMMKVNEKKFNEHKRIQLETMVKLREDVRQLTEDDNFTLGRIESFQNQLRTIQGSWLSFAKSFLSIDTRVHPEDLVTISTCKVNEPPQQETVQQRQRLIRARRSKFLLS